MRIFFVGQEDKLSFGNLDLNGSYFHIVIIPKDCKRNKPYDKNCVYKHSSTAILTLLKLYRISNCYNYECYFLQCLIVN